MEKNIILNGQKTDFWLEDTGRLHNVKTNRWLKGGMNKGYHFYSLYFKGKQYISYTHRAVAEYFVNNPYFESLYKDYRKTGFYKQTIGQCTYLKDFVANYKKK